MTDFSLEKLAHTLRNSSVFQGKKKIELAARAFPNFEKDGILNGDDAAAIPDGNGGWLLLAAEGIISELCRDNPELAGRSAVLANVNDIYAMGGYPLALVDITGAQNDAVIEEIFKGIATNARRFDVPVVGGHILFGTPAPQLAMAILGKAKTLITSSNASPKDDLVLVTNLDGIWLKNSNYYNCTLPRHDAYLKRNLELLPQAAEEGLIAAGKDVSMAGIAGTLIMLCEGSHVGAVLNIQDVPMPADSDFSREISAWLSAFMSYGFLLAVKPEAKERLLDYFKRHNLFAGKIGEFTKGSQIKLTFKSQTAELWDWQKAPFTGFTGKKDA